MGIPGVQNLIDSTKEPCWICALGNQKLKGAQRSGSTRLAHTCPVKTMLCRQLRHFCYQEEEHHRRPVRGNFFLSVFEQDFVEGVSKKSNVVATISNMLKRIRTMSEHDGVIAFSSDNEAVLFPQDLLHVLAENDAFMKKSVEYEWSRCCYSDGTMSHGCGRIYSPCSNTQFAFILTGSAQESEFVGVQVSLAELVTFCVRYDAEKFEAYFTNEELQPLLVGQEVASLSLISELSEKHPDLAAGACVATVSAHRTAPHVGQKVFLKGDKQKPRVSESVWLDYC